MHNSQASYVIVSGFRAALDLDTYPHSKLIRPRCTERAKPGRSKPELIMNIAVFRPYLPNAGVLAKSPCFFYLALVALKLLVSLISRLVACSAKMVVDRQQTHRTTTVTLAAHARRGLIIFVLCALVTYYSDINIYSKHLSGSIFVVIILYT